MAPINAPRLLLHRRNHKSEDKVDLDCVDKIITRSVAAAGSADTVCPRRPLMTQIQHRAKTDQTDHVTLRP